MKTAKEIRKDFDNGVVTPETLGALIYSVNKRAKNHRDKEREYRELRRNNRYFIDKYDNEGKAKSMKLYYYRMKDTFLTFLQPCEVHRATRVRWFDGEECLFAEYFLFYAFGGYTFHTPIEAEEVKNFSNLTVKDLEYFETVGEDVSDLLSVTFCKKVLNALQTGAVHIQKTA